MSTATELLGNGDSGSPLVIGSIRASKSCIKVGSITDVGLRPPPGRRMRSGAKVSGDSNSLLPLMMVLRLMPVARDTAEIPPRPRACASVAAQRRLLRSVITGRSFMYFSLICCSSAILRVSAQDAAPLQLLSYGS